MLQSCAKHANARGTEYACSMSFISPGPVDQWNLTGSDLVGQAFRRAGLGRNLSPHARQLFLQFGFELPDGGQLIRGGSVALLHSLNFRGDFLCLGRQFRRGSERR